MRKPRLAALALLATALTTITDRTARAWEAPYISDGISRLIEQARVATDVTGFRMYTGGFSLLGGFLTMGNELSLNTQLVAGKTYLFVGAGDRDVQDVDIIVESADGQDSAADVETDNTPWVLVSPSKTQKYKVRIYLHAAPEGQQHFNLFAILESPGQSGSLDSLAAAAHQLNAVVEAASSGANVEFEKAPGMFCFLGGLMRDGQDLRLDRNFTANTSYLICGWSDENANDMDMDVSAGGNVLGQDADDDSTPVVEFRTGAGVRARLTMSMFSADRPSFGVAAILVKN